VGHAVLIMHETLSARVILRYFFNSKKVISRRSFTYLEVAGSVQVSDDERGVAGRSMGDRHSVTTNLPQYQVDISNSYVNINERINKYVFSLKSDFPGLDKRKI